MMCKLAKNLQKGFAFFEKKLKQTPTRITGN